MKTTAALIKLTRPMNLFMIALTMALMRYFVLQPLVAMNGFSLQLSGFYFFLLVLSTVMIAAGGNVINDYFDQRTDRINKPKHIIVGVQVKRRVAMAVHQMLTVFGLGLAFYIAWKVGMWSLSIVSFFAAGSLWFYSVQFKRDLIVGNIVIALLAGLVPLLVGIYEVPLLVKKYGAEVAEYFMATAPEQDPMIYFKIMFYFIFGYAGFAFLLNLIREIQKDMADVKGDKRIGARTIPLVFGIKKAKRVTALLLVVATGALIWVQQVYIDNAYALVYLLAAVVVPMALSFLYNWKAVYRRDFVKAGNYLKIAMLGGLLYSVVHYFIYYAANIP